MLIHDFEGTTGTILTSVGTFDLLSENWLSFSILSSSAEFEYSLYTDNNLHEMKDILHLEMGTQKKSESQMGFEPMTLQDNMLS